MLRQACVATLVLLVALNLGGLSVDEADAHEHGWANKQLLRSFGPKEIFAQNDKFVLDFDPVDPKGGGEHFERYFFQVEPIVPGPVEGVAFAEFEVYRQSTSDLICRGQLMNVNGFLKRTFCDDIRAGHHYAIEWTMVMPGEIHLYGVNPLAPIKHS